MNEETEMGDACVACEKYGSEKCVHTTPMRKKFDIQQVFFDQAVASIRREKDELRTQLAAALEREKRLKTIGSLMANVCFNLKQKGVSFTDREREIMARLQHQWDAALAQKPEGG